MNNEEHPEILDQATRKALLIDQLQQIWEDAIAAALAQGVSPQEVAQWFTEEYVPHWHATHDQQIEREKARLKEKSIKIANAGLGEQASNN